MEEVLPLRASYDEQMTSARYLWIALLSLGLVIFAVILQQVGYQGVSFLPCPLCILQRIGYLGIAAFCLLALGLRPLRKLFHGLAILSAAYGLSVAGHQVWLPSPPNHNPPRECFEHYLVSSEQFHFYKAHSIFYPIQV